MWDMPHSSRCVLRVYRAYTAHVPHICADSYMRHDSFIYETWLIHIWDMTHAYMRHASFIYETWLIHIWDMTHSYMRHDSFIYETWLIHTWDMPHAYMRLASLHIPHICIHAHRCTQIQHGTHIIRVYTVAKMFKMRYLYRSFSHKRNLWIVAYLRKETCNSRHPMHRRHPVLLLLLFSLETLQSLQVIFHKRDPRLLALLRKETFNL